MLSNTSEVCCPNPGAALAGPSFPAWLLNWNGILTSLCVVPGSCSNAPTATACSSCSISSYRLTGVCHTSAASKISCHSSYVLVAITSSTTTVALRQSVVVLATFQSNGNCSSSPSVF